MTNPTRVNRDQPIPELVADLGASDFLKRQRARLILAYRGKESVPALLDALKSNSETTRWEAVQALGDIRDPESAPALVDMLTDDATGVRWAAMESLIRMGRMAMQPLLERFVKNFDSLWLREGVHHILHVLNDRHVLNERERVLFEELEKHIIPGVESGWTSQQAWAAERALEYLDLESIQTTGNP